MVDHKREATFPFRLDVAGVVTQGQGRHALDAIDRWAVSSHGTGAAVKCCGHGMTRCCAIVTFPSGESVEVMSRLLGPDELWPAAAEVI